MQSDSFTFQAADGQVLSAYRWQPVQGEAKATVQIVHGMCEHAGRYARTANFFAERGYRVYAHDQRGHGQTAGSPDNLAHFADKNGWELAVLDIRQLTETIEKNNPNDPVFVLGHSMGALLVTDYIAAHGASIQGAVTTGLPADPGLLGTLGTLIAKAQCAARGERNRAQLINHLNFGGFNRLFKPIRTDFDWLSRDPAEVDRYLDDPLCGAVPTSGFFRDLLYGVGKVYSKHHADGIPKNLPIFLLSGEKDPVSQGGKAVLQLKRALSKVGVADVETKIYPGARHEILNEINRDEVMADIAGWLDRHF